MDKRIQQVSDIEMRISDDSRGGALQFALIVLVIVGVLIFFIARETSSGNPLGIGGIPFVGGVGLYLIYRVTSGAMKFDIILDKPTRWFQISAVYLFLFERNYSGDCSQLSLDIKTIEYPDSGDSYALRIQASGQEFLIERDRRQDAEEELSRIQAFINQS